MKGIIISDSLDSRLGNFFKYCTDGIINEVDARFTEYTYLVDQNVDNISLSLILKYMYSDINLFVAYCHGDRDMFLCKEGEMLLSTHSQELSKLSDTIVYSYSCSAALDLGPKIIAAGGKCFIGYIGEIIIVTSFENEFMTCINAGINQLLAGSSSEIAHKAIIHQYRNFMKVVDFFVKAVMNDNVDRLVLLGDPNAKLY